MPTFTAILFKASLMYQHIPHRAQTPSPGSISEVEQEPVRFGLEKGKIMRAVLECQANAQIAYAARFLKPPACLPRNMLVLQSVLSLPSFSYTLSVLLACLIQGVF
jgi:hypothetical protein